MDASAHSHSFRDIGAKQNSHSRTASQLSEPREQLSELKEGVRNTKIERIYGILNSFKVILVLIG